MRPKIVNCHCGHKGEKLINGIIQVIGSRESAAIRWQHSTKKSRWVKRYKNCGWMEIRQQGYFFSILWQPTVSAKIGLQHNFETKILCRGNRLGIWRSHSPNVPPTTLTTKVKRRLPFSLKGTIWGRQKSTFLGHSPKARWRWTRTWIQAHLKPRLCCFFLLLWYHISSAPLISTQQC